MEIYRVFILHVLCVHQIPATQTTQKRQHDISWTSEQKHVNIFQRNEPLGPVWSAPPHHQSDFRYVSELGNLKTNGLITEIHFQKIGGGVAKWS